MELVSESFVESFSSPPSLKKSNKGFSCDCSLLSDAIQPGNLELLHSHCIFLKGIMEVILLK